MPRGPSYDLTGKRFGRLLVVGSLMVGPKSKWMCHCDCGNKAALVWSGHLRTGRTVSCGCYHREILPLVRLTHGMGGKGGLVASEYRIWAHMKNRCHRASDKAYANYGGRGIVVCERWREDFAAFFADMGPRPPGTSIDRIDNDGPYAPGNCRWATRRQQSLNKRNTVFVIHDGRRTTLKDLSETLDVGYATLEQRRKRDRPLDAPVRDLQPTLIEHEGRTINLRELSRVTGIAYSTLYTRRKLGKPLLVDRWGNTFVT